MKRISAKFGKSLLACIVANIAGWLVSLPVNSLYAWLISSHHNLTSSSALFRQPLMLVITALVTAAFSFLPSAIVGLPIQALLQKVRCTGLILNVTTAVIIGYPIGIVWMTFLFSEQGQFNADNLFSQFKYGFQGHAGYLLIPVFLMSGAITFWLIRRPDMDAKPLP